jgi:hypothetical protein
MTAVLQELAKHLSYAAIVCGMHAPDDHAVAAQLKARSAPQVIGEFADEAKQPTTFRALAISGERRSKHIAVSTDPFVLEIQSASSF